MKYSNIKVILLTILLNSITLIDLLAKKRPPTPFDNSTGFDDSLTVGSPIDDAIPLLFIGALLLGIWATHKYNVKYISK